jgi:hypothetical protein
MDERRRVVAVASGDEVSFDHCGEPLRRAKAAVVIVSRSGPPIVDDAMRDATVEWSRVLAGSAIVLVDVLLVRGHQWRSLAETGC